MFSKMSKRTKVSSLIGLLCIPFLVGGTYFYYQNTIEPVHTRIYMLPERSKKRAEPSPTSFQQVVVRPTTQTPTYEESHDDYVEYVHHHDSVSSGHGDESDSVLTDTSKPEDITNDEDDFSVRLANLTAQIEILATQINEKYPELATLAYLSLDEIHELYPTPEALAELAKQSETAQAEFMEAFSDLFSELPTEIREECLSAARETFVASWGAETADAIMAGVRSHLGL